VGRFLAWVLHFLRGRAEERRFRLEAEERAEALLRDSLSEEEWRTWQQFGYVEVRSRLHPDRRYLVAPDTPVIVLERGRAVGAICIQPQERLPRADRLLAKKLLAEGDEGTFLRVGNWIPLLHGGVPARELMAPARAAGTLALVWLVIVASMGVVALLQWQGALFILLALLTWGAVASRGRIFR
jgi:hypothetical protein